MNNQKTIVEQAIQEHNVKLAKIGYYTWGDCSVRVRFGRVGESDLADIWYDDHGRRASEQHLAGLWHDGTITWMSLGYRNWQEPDGDEYGESVGQFLARQDAVVPETAMFFHIVRWSGDERETEIEAWVSTPKPSWRDLTIVHLQKMYRQHKATLASTAGRQCWSDHDHQRQQRDYESDVKSLGEICGKLTKFGITA